MRRKEMKSKLTKILLFALVFVLLFGTLVPAAYESYDTYTYSIDGKALLSPAAYTPASTTYDSESMGLLAGNNWKYDDDGDVAIWAGDMDPEKLMQDEKNAFTFSVDGIVFTLNADESAYIASAISSELLCFADVEALLKEYAENYKTPEPSDDPDAPKVETVTVKFGAANLKGSEDYATLTKDNALAAVKHYLDATIADAAAKEANAGKTIVLDINYNSIFTELYNAAGIIKLSLKIPATIEHPSNHKDIPVTVISAGLFNAEKDEYAKKVVLGRISNLIIGKNIAEIGENAFAGVTLSTVYYEVNEAKTANINIAAGNNSLKRSVSYYYSASRKFGNMELKGNDVVADNEGNLYIADSGNNRIVVLNKHDYTAIGVMRNYVDEYGRKQQLKNPTGVYVTDPNKMVDGSSHIFVCDNGNERIVVFDRDYNYVRTIEKPQNALLQQDGNNVFVPYAMAVDIYGRIFVVSLTCYQGVIVLSNDGEFTGFIGSQKVTVDVIDKIWQNFTSASDREAGTRNLSEPFNNITVDDDGFVYVTINFTKLSDLEGQLSSIKGKESTYSPVKKLNSTGVEIMKRNGFFDPGGEVDVFMAEEVSKIIDVAIGDQGSWTILDVAKNSFGGFRSRTFTYDKNGNLLFAFGDSGDQIGNGENCLAMTYQVLPTTKIVDGKEVEDGIYNLVILDSTQTGNKIMVYTPTEYCDKIMAALENENQHKYSDTITAWQEVLTSNNNFDLAYIGIGKALYNQGNYEEAMDMLASAYETEYYAKAFTAVRKGIMSVWMIPVIIGIIVLLVLFFKFLGWAKKRNKATSLKVGKRTYVEELLYVFHLVFHPFDGFWDLKHEKRGSVRAGATILAITVAAFFYQAIGKGYTFNPRGDYSTVLLQVGAILVPVVLFVVANWCLTTLFDGEGSLKDIFVATCYSLAPLPFFVIISTILTNIFTVDQSSMVNLLITIGYIWLFLLLFFGMSVTHDYTNGKNMLALIGTVAAMAVIMFIAILFSSLVIKMVTFIIAIVTEIGSRI